MAQLLSTTARPFSRLILRSALPLGLFFIIFGAKLLVIDKFGSDLPFWDQWDGEAGMVFLPYFAGKLTFLHLFVPHNEHRIFFTKLLSLGLLLWNGQWDARLECVVNAALHAAILAALLVWVRRYFGPAVATAACLILIAVAAPPLVWENTLGGFQSQFYFLIAFSFLAMWLFLNTPNWSWRWWLAILCALAAIFSMGSGFFCVLPVFALLVLQLGLGRANLPAKLPTLAACCIISALGWVLHTDVPGHVPLHARNIHDFLTALMHAAAWPKAKHTGPSLLLYLPLVLFSLFLFGRWRKTIVPVSFQFVLAGGLWVLLQAAATAYARGAGGALPANRYGDILALGVFFNGLALASLLKESPRKYLFICVPLAVVWALTLANGIRFHAKDEINSGLPGKKAWSSASEMNVRDYLLIRHFEKSDFGALPYPSADALAGMLDQPIIREILPVSVRLPLAVDGAAVPASSFAIGAVSPATPPLAHRKTWGSFTAGGRAAQGTWRSLPRPATRGGFWRFEIAGGLGQPGLSLQLVSASTGAVVADVKPAKLPGDAWHTINVRAPRKTCILVARDASPTGWFAFSEPVEMATGSWIAAKLAQSASWFLAAGCALGLAGIAATLKR